MNFKTRHTIYILNRGGIISLPTDTIQGLSCLPEFDRVLLRMLQLKYREASKGLILLASKAHYFSNFVEDESLLEKIKINAQPTTYLLKANQNISPLLTGQFDTIALRLTDNKLIEALCQATNSALVSTSANVSGRQTAKTLLKLRVFFQDRLDFVIAPNNQHTTASNIINLQTGERMR